MEFELPLRLAPKAPLLLVPVFINGKGPFDFILDTGAARTVLSSPLAGELGLTDRPTAEGAMGAGGNTKVASSIVRLEAFTLGPAKRKDWETGCIDFSPISQQLGTKIGGVVGHDFLQDFVLTVDYPAGSLHFASAKAAPARSSHPAKAELTFERTPIKPLLRIPVHINGRGPFPFVLDTGASASLVSDQIAKQLNLPDQGAATFSGCAGNAPGRFVQIESLAIGSALIPQVKVAAGGGFLEAASQQAGAKLDGVLGYDFLKNFRVQIDFGARLLRLE